MNKGNQQNRKGRIGRRLLAVLICLLTIMPMVGSALPEFTDMMGDVVGSISDALGSLKRPDADSYSEGAKYLDDFLKEHPDATVFGRDEDGLGQAGTRPMSVGTPGDRIDPDWFQAVVNVMGVLKTQGEFTLRPTNSTRALKPGEITLWEATSKIDSLVINYPDEGDGKRYTDEKTWPISGFMNWVTIGDYQYIEGGNYPELGTKYDEKDIDYGITSAYLGTSRVYNVGVIATKEKGDDGVEKVVKYLWVSVAEDGADDSVIVLPYTTPNHNVTLHFGPREYPVSYDIVVDDLYLGKNGAGTDAGAGKVSKNLSDMTLDEIKMVWEGNKDSEGNIIRDTDGNVVPEGCIDFTGITTPEAAREAVIQAVLGDLGSDSETVTSSQTARFNVAIPSGTYGDISYVTAKEPDADVPVYPATAGYGNNRLGTETTYEFGSETEDRSTDYWSAITGEPDRYSLSELYTIGEDESIRSAVTVTVTVTRRWGVYNDDTNPNGYQTHFKQIQEYGGLGTSAANAAIGNLNGSGNRVYNMWLNAGNANPKAPGLEQNLVQEVKTPCTSESFNATMMYTMRGVSGAAQLTYLEINDQEVALPNTTASTQYSKSAVTTLDDGAKVVVYFAATGSGGYGVSTVNDYFKNTWGLSTGEVGGARLYVIRITGAKRDINITGYEKDNDTTSSSSVGKLIVQKASGVNVQLWYYSRYSSRGNAYNTRSWQNYAEKGWVRIRFHRNIDQHGRFRFAFDGSEGPTTSNAYQEYNIRVTLKNGYYWPDTDRDGIFKGSKIENAVTYTYTASTGNGHRESAGPATDTPALYTATAAPKTGVSYKYQNMAIPVNSPTISGNYNNTQIVFNGDGTYTATLARNSNTNTTYSGLKGKWSYADGRLTVTPDNYGRANAEIATADVDESGMLAITVKDQNTTNTNTACSATFTFSASDLPTDPNGAYYASLANLPYLRDRSSRNTKLYIEAMARTYELNYLTGVDSNGLGIGPNGEYDGRLPGINVRSTSMPYNQTGYTDTTNYSKANGQDEKGKYYVNFFHVYNKTPEDIPNDVGASYKFQYWVLTDSQGNPIGEDGKVIVRQEGESIEEWQAKFITFYPSDSIALSNFDSLLMATKKDIADGEEVKEEDYTIEFDKSNQKFKFYLTACWTPDATKPFTNYISVNSRADVENGKTNTVTWFEGDWYDVESGEKQENKPVDLAGFIRAAYSYTSFLDKAAAGGNDKDGVTITINKDELTEYMRRYAQNSENPEREKYLWYTFDPAQNGWNESYILNGSYIWKKVPDKAEVPVWFLYTLGGVKINTDINGYDQPLPYKLTFTLPTYEGEDRNPLIFEEDGSVLDENWDPYDYRYTAGNESLFFRNPVTGKYEVKIQLGTGTHRGDTETTDDGRKILKNTDYTVKDGDDKYLFLTAASNGKVKVENYLGNETAFEGITTGETSSTATLKLTRDKDDPTGQTYYAIIYLGKGDSITIPELPEKTTYALELYNVYEHPEFKTDVNENYELRHKYDGYVMRNAVGSYYKDGGETSTIWKSTKATTDENAWVKILDGSHNLSQDYFNVAMTEKDILNKDNKVIGKLTGFASAEYKNGNDTYKGINAYDTQVINVTTDGTYNLYLDQYTTTETDDDHDGYTTDLDSWTTGDELQVQNFNYLSYITSAYNLTAWDQTLQISFEVESTHVGSTKEDLRYLAISKINGVDQSDWNPEDGENHEGALGSIKFVLSDGRELPGSWKYDAENHKIVATVANVPAGEKVTLTVRTTVPAVNAAVKYVASATLISTLDEKAGEFSDTPVQADVFSNWLRIAAFIGSGTYELTKDDLRQEFLYTVTLTDPAGTRAGEGPISIGNKIRFMLYTNSADYGTENGIACEVTITQNGSFTFNLNGAEVLKDSDGNPWKDKDGNDVKNYLKHDWRIVIYEIFNPEEPADPNADPNVEPTDGKFEPLNGVGYKVTWTPKEGQAGKYSVYVNTYDGGRTLGDKGVYSNRDGCFIADGSVDMVVFRYMPIADLTVSKEVVGNNAERNYNWTFEIQLSNDDLNQLAGGNDLVFEPSEEAYNTYSWKTNADGSVTLTVTLRHGQSVTIKGLPQGTKYVITESAYDSGLSFSPSYVITDGDITNEDGTDTGLGVHKAVRGKTKAEGMVYKYQKAKTTGPDGEEVWTNATDDEENEIPAKNIVAYTNSMSGDLVIEKEVPGYVSEGDNRDKNSFTFEVTLTAPEGGDLSGMDGLTPKTNENGEVIPGVYTVTVTINAGEENNDGTWIGSAKIEGLPNGTHYVVAETNCGTDYIPTYTGNNGDIAGGTSKVVCTNAKTGTLVVQKKVTGNSGSKVDDFTFTITFENADASLEAKYEAAFAEMTTVDDANEVTQTVDSVTWKTVDGKLTATFSLKHGQQLTVSGLPAGTTYTVEETVNNSYTTTVKVDDGEAEERKAVSGTVALWSENGGTVVYYENYREGATPGGINLPFLWAIPLCLLAIGGAAAIVIKRRRRVAL